MVGDCSYVSSDCSVSTYLVTNAQFPDKIRALEPVTQLYVSIDAATPETLKDVDRPLFADFWERLLQSLRELRLKEVRSRVKLSIRM
jgi:tRNA wybutosine-synthesizing protein 1